MIEHDRVRVETFVRVPQAQAFAVFTEEIDRWWRRGFAFRASGRGPGTMYMETRAGGRIFERYGGEASCLHEVGTIVAWEPPAHLVFEWRGMNFVPGEATVVEIWFEPAGEGTRVRLEHRAWSTIRPDHPVRHGHPPVEFLGQIAMWWAAHLRGLRDLAEEPLGRGDEGE